MPHTVRQYVIRGNALAQGTKRGPGHIFTGGRRRRGQGRKRWQRPPARGARVTPAATARGARVTPAATAREARVTPARLEPWSGPSRGRFIRCCTKSTFYHEENVEKAAIRLRVSRFCPMQSAFRWIFLLVFYHFVEYLTYRMGKNVILVQVGS